MNVTEVAKSLGVSNQWVLDRIHGGQLKATKISPRKWIITEQDLNALVGKGWFK